LSIRLEGSRKKVRGERSQSSIIVGFSRLSNKEKREMDEKLKTSEMLEFVELLEKERYLRKPISLRKRKKKHQHSKDDCLTQQ